jgi:hypothetical protein
MKQSERRAQRIAAGLCRYCGKTPSTPGRTECNGCRESKNASQRALRLRRIQSGVCSHCGKRVPKPTALVCERCTPRRKGSGAYERKTRVGDIKYLSLVEPYADKRQRRSSESGFYYIVEIRSLGREFRKTFGFGKHHGRGRAFLAALKWRDDHLAALGIPKDSSAPFFSRSFKTTTEKEDHSTGVVGVSYHNPGKSHKGFFSATWRENKVPCRKTFAVSKYGFEGALQAAIDQRRERVASIYGKRSVKECRRSFGDFLDHGEAYYIEGRKNESGAIAGVVFENTIRRMCDKHKISEKGKKLDDLISALSKANVLSKTKAKRARVAAHVRTQATHAQWGEFDLSDVGVTIAFCRELLLQNLGKD